MIEKSLSFALFQAISTLVEGICPVSGTLSIGNQDLFSYYPQIADCKQRDELSRVLGQATIARLVITELTLDV